MNATPGASQLWRILKEKIGMLSPVHQNTEATRLAERLVDVAKRGFPSGHANIAESLEILANLYIEAGRPRDAAELLLELYESQVKQEEQTDPTILFRSGSTLASLFLAMDQNENAALIYERILPRAPVAEDTGEMEPSLPGLYGNYAVTLNRLGRDQEAEVNYVKALELYEQADPESPALGVMQDHLGEFYLSRGRLKEAEQVYARGLQFRRRNVSVEPGELATAYGNLAAVHHSAGHLEEAEAFYQSALEILDERGGPLSDGEIVTLQNYAALFQVTNRKRKAVAIEKRIARS